MSNGKNNWGVAFSKIAWLGEALKNHGNVCNLQRHDDIIFEVNRKNGDTIILICLDEYVCGEAVVQRVLSEFPEVNCISIGGNWNKYTKEAKELCLSKKIALYNSSELTGGLWKDEFWSYCKKDKDGNPAYPYTNS